MWKGCLLLVIALGGGLYLEYRWIAERGLPHPWVAAGTLGFGVMMMVGSLHGLWLAFRKSVQPESDSASWQDGQQVRVGGIIRPLRQALKAPFSGADAVIFEYKMWQSMKSGSQALDHRGDATVRGIEMVPCSLWTANGSIALNGFPPLTHIPEKSFSGADYYPRAARKLVNTRWELASARNAVAVIGKSMAGDLLHPPWHQINRQALDWLVAPAGLPSAASWEGGPPAQLQGAAAEQELVRRLSAGGWVFYEQTIAAGAEVTVEGTYRANPPGIDIAQAIAKPQHTIHLGLAAQTASREWIHTLLFVIVFGVILAGLHYLVYANDGEIYRRLVEEFGV